jgi:hypothetical protein
MVHLPREPNLLPDTQIVGAIAPVRDQLDACLIFPSMPGVPPPSSSSSAAAAAAVGAAADVSSGCRETSSLHHVCDGPLPAAVMKLNKLGTFSMSQLGQSKSIIGDFIKSARKNNDNFEEGLLKLVRRDSILGHWYPMFALGKACHLIN